MAFGGAALKFIQTFLYAIEFCCAGIILGIYSYFLSVLADRNETITKWEQAVEGLSGAAVLYTIFAVLLTCFLGGKAFFAFLGIIFDLLFAGAFVALAILTRDGADKCSGHVNTPLGSGDSRDKQGFGSNGQGRQITYAASLGATCRLNSACFAVSILGAILFLISAIVQLFIARHHKKEKRFGPGPKNNYTRGSGGAKFWQRGRKNRNSTLRDPEMAGAVPATSTLAPAHHDVRPSHDTAYTGTTAGRDSAAYENPHKPLAGGYHTAPTGTYQAPATTYDHTAPTGTFNHASNYQTGHPAAPYNTTTSTNY